MRTRILVALAALLCLAAGAQVAWSQTGGRRGAAASFRLVKVASGLSSPVYATSAPGDTRLFVVEQAGTIRTVSKGKVASKPYADLRSVVQAGGEQGLLSVAFSPELREERQALRLFHEQGRQRGRVGVARAQGCGERPARSPPAAGDPGHGVQPQRRPAGVRPRRDALHRRRRRRRRRRSARRARQRAEPRRPARQAAAHRRDDAQQRAPVRHPQGQPVRRPVRLAARDLGARPAQSVALLLRPRQRRSLDRRCRPERVGRGRPPQARRRRHQLRLEPLRGPPRLREGHAAGRREAADARRGVQPLGRAAASRAATSIAGRRSPG